MTDQQSETKDATPTTGPKAGRGVHLTERAAKEIQRVIAEQNFPADSTWVRIGAKGGGCRGKAVEDPAVQDHAGAVGGKALGQGEADALA